MRRYPCNSAVEKVCFGIWAAKEVDRAARSTAVSGREGVVIEGVGKGEGFSVGLVLVLPLSLGGDFGDSRKKRRNSAQACSCVARLYCTFLSMRPGLNNAESNLSM